MAEDALPKDERRQTMKRIIAILLALIMIFAFAACKGKDDKNDTTAESSQDAQTFRTPRRATRRATRQRALLTTRQSHPPRAAARRLLRVSRAASRATSPQLRSRLPSMAARLISLRSSTNTLRL